MSSKSRAAAVWSAFRRWVRENGWLLPATGALVGIALGELVFTLEGPPSPAAWAISVDRARETLLASLAIVFTGLSIVLALTATVASSVASRFSIRLLRVQQRGWRDKVVIASFTLTTAFIFTTQIELRALAADQLAPRTGLVIAAALVVLSGATIIWYISASMRSLRLDRVMQVVIRLIRRTVRTVERSQHGELPAPASALEAPTGATSLPAHRTGYVERIDMEGIYALASQADVRVGVTVLVGTAVVSGEPVGWLCSKENLPPHVRDQAAAEIQIALSRDPEYDAAYGIRILVDIAVMALSPAVNDPYTAVEVINELTFLLIEIAHHRPGPRGRVDPAGELRVVRAARTLGDYLDLATAPILLYGGSDNQVTEALARLAATVEAACDTDADRQRVRAFAEGVAAAEASQGEATTVSNGAGNG